MCRPLAAIEARARRLLEGAGALLLAALFVLVMTAVVARYVAGAGFVWSDELASWLFLRWSPPACRWRRRACWRCGSTSVVRALPPGWRRIAAVAADGIAFHGALVLASGGAGVAALVGGQSTVLGLPEWLRFAAFAGGGALTILTLLLAAIRERGLVAAAASLLVGIGLHTAAQASFDMAVTPSLVATVFAGAGLLLGAPLPFALLAGVSMTGPFGGLIPEPAIVQTMVGGAGKFLLLAIPFFLLAGELLTEGGWPSG